MVLHLNQKGGAFLYKKDIVVFLQFFYLLFFLVYLIVSGETRNIWFILR